MYKTAEPEDFAERIQESVRERVYRRKGYAHPGRRVDREPTRAETPRAA